LKRIKVAIDVSIPPRVVRLLQTGFGDQGFEFVYLPQFAAGNSPDEFWAVAFKRFGGQIVLSGDKNIAKKPHQVIAFKENGLICFFCDRRWAAADLTFKAAHLVYWWPRIQARISESKPRDCWWVPMAIKDQDFRKVEIPDHVEAKAAKERAKQALHRSGAQSRRERRRTRVR
jgi:hypothetical protein